MYKKLGLLIVMAVGMLAVFPVAKADVQDVSFRFCDDTGNKDFLAGKKTIFVTPGEETEICLNFDTSSKEPRKILYGFTEGLLSAGGNQICDADKGTGNDFSKYFIGTTERSFMIQAGQPKTIKEKILLPVGMSGVQYGCIAYALSTLEGSGLGGMFNLVVNKVFPISLFVGNSADIKNDFSLLKNSGGAYSTNNKVKATVDEENTLKLSFLAENNGNISQNVEITGKVYNMLGFEKTFSVQMSNIAPNEQKEIVADVGIVPFYKGFFTVKFTVHHMPKFDFDTKGMDEKILQGGTIMDQAQIYVFSRITLALIILAILIIFKLFRPRKKIIVKA